MKCYLDTQKSLIISLLLAIVGAAVVPTSGAAAIPPGEVCRLTVRKLLLCSAMQIQLMIHLINHQK